MKHELDTNTVLRHALEQGKKCFAPKVLTKEIILMLRVYSIEDLETFQESNWGIPEPGLMVSTQFSSTTQSSNIDLQKYLALVAPELEVPPVSEGICHYREEIMAQASVDQLNLDLILVPALAIDTKRNRLGYGRGYYDRFLNTLRKYSTLYGKNMPKTLGLVLDQQVLISPTMEYLHECKTVSGETDCFEIPTDEFDYTIDEIMTATYNHKKE